MPDSESTSHISLPLCVDLDGTLLLTDSLWESCLRLVGQKPYLLLLFPFWLLLGKAKFKHAISQHIELDPESLIYNSELLKYLSSEKLKGRQLFLVTAASNKIAESIANYLKIFDGVLSSDNQRNLSGKNKAKSLVDMFGEKGFVYAGNAGIDLNVWKNSAAAIVVNAPDSLTEQAKKITAIEHTIPKHSSLSLKVLFKAIRVHQWAKNMLIFTALILSHSWGKEAAIQSAIFAFVSFSFAASTIYLLNDLIDLEADRNHPVKKHRPLASGALRLQWGVILIPLLLLVSIVLALQVNTEFFQVLIIYVLLTTAYSLFLKPVALLDVITLTSLYTLRIIAGTVAIGVPLSYWLLAFSMFIFLSLALIKRYSELYNLIQQGNKTVTTRGYHTDDLSAISLFGISSGYLSVMVLVLYIHDLQADAHYSQPDWLWFVAVAVLYWVSRMWLLTQRGQMNEDPVYYAINDRTSYLTSLVIVTSLFLAL